MPEKFVDCPECDARLRVKAPEGKTSIRCPKCGASIPLRARRADVPVAAALPDEDDEDLDEVRRVRPRKKRKKSEDKAPSPMVWGIGCSACFVGALVIMLAFLLLLGKHGLPKSAPGQPEGAQTVAMVIFLVVGAILILSGIHGVDTKRAVLANRFRETEYTGTMAVWVGTGQAIAGSVLTGVGIYGLIWG
jgi:DNA-directed RNA polymerase subunit M/transcription elongation factor TFIIS